MFFSKTCEYAMRALACLALEKSDGFVQVESISKKATIARPYAAKIFQQLVKAGILKSQRGPCGGVAFLRSPDKVSLFEVVEAIEKITFFENCVMGLDRCEDKNSCPLHATWKEMNKKIVSSLKKTKITDLKAKVNTFKFRDVERLKLKSSMNSDQS